MEKTSNHYIVILCGGSGPRLWPLSRADHPKQFLQIDNQYSLLQNTILRFKKIVSSENIFIVSNEKYLPILKKQIGTLVPLKNILTEPEKKNTTAAIIFASTYINSLHSHPIITSSPSDHHISQIDKFTSCIKLSATKASSSNKIVAIGIKPTSANSSYGYIIPGQKFVEKPDIKEADKLIKLGALWNSGIYTFNYQTLLSELATHQKDIFNLSKLIQNHSTDQTSIKNFFHQVPSISFDIAISEKTKNLATLLGKFTWSDIGEWKTIYQTLAKKPDQNVTLNTQTKFVDFHSSGCLISSNPDKLIGLVGINHLAIIDTPDSLLICQLSDSFDVRNLVTKIVKKKNIAHYFLKSYDQQKLK
ncbi:MAG: mannose-1-phosphate guanylyltransferase [Candidatus Shapirobacteria bacterium]|nr:mannose-1-phosphate guanylyltransferase [Candidatus Shapirobacteria bacterium]